jgi:hypothetical protein
MLFIVAVLAWVIPGAGHFFIRERKRAIIIFFTITITFLTGIYVGSIGVVDPVTAKVWYYAQMLVTPFVGIIGRITANGQFPVYGKPAEIGQIYTCTAGLMNLLCIISAVYMAYCGRGEMIGDQEENE